MNTKLLTAGLALSLFLGFGIPSASLPSVLAQALTPSERSQIETDVRKALAKPAVVAVGKSPMKGAVNAPLTLVEFSDFQCPYCSRARAEFIEPMLKRYPGKIRFVYKNFPLQMHEHSFPAAKAAWAAGQQGKFFEYHDQLFDRQTELGEPTFVDIARKLKLNETRFNKDRQSPQAEQAVKADMAQGNTLGLRGTPTFVLNGVMFQAGTPLTVIDVIVDVLKKDQGLKI